MRHLLSREAPAAIRLLLALLVGALVALLLPGQHLPLTLRLLCGWSATALVFLAWVWLMIMRVDGKETQRLATREDDSRVVSSLLVLLGSVASLIGTGFALSDAQQLENAGRETLSTVLTGVAVLSVVLSWLVIHTEWTLHYARLYHADPVGGVNFPKDEHDPEGEHPDYRDFAYLSFTVGMTYQVSDTDITQKRIRRALLRHALLSFLFGTVIVAFTINVVAGLIK